MPIQSPATTTTTGKRARHIAAAADQSCRASSFAVAAMIRSARSLDASRFAVIVAEASPATCSTAFSTRSSARFSIRCTAPPTWLTSFWFAAACALSPSIAEAVAAWFFCASATKLCEAALSRFPSRLCTNSLSVLSISLSLLSTLSICGDVLTDGCEVDARSMRLLISSSPPPESNENSELLAGIASTLAGMSVNLNGESLKGSASKSEAAAKHLDESRAKFERAANGAQKAWRESITQASAEATSAISTARDQAVQSIERAAADAGAVATAKIDAANERAEKIIATTAKLEARQLWSVAASMCLALLPVAVIVAGVWMAVAGLITGAQWALDVDGSVWLGIGRWLVVSMGLAGAGYGLFASVRWVAGLVETWKGRGMPRWPRWR